MANDERVEAAARAVWKHATKDVNGRIDEASCTRVARRALAAAGVDALEAENARLSAVIEMTSQGALVLYEQRDAARRELADLRAGVEALADEWADAFITGRGPTVPLHERVTALRALLAAAPSEPAPEVSDER